MDKTINLEGIEAIVVNDTVRNSNTGILFEVAFDYFGICNLTIKVHGHIL